ncbi:hypothetical protein TRIUR3_26652 [Triticum urartu]|uniref:Uncharacterized protein n=1 Tax=Triticum urartu TaxID=4572 RepID=M8A1E2_TRIUA|nr:hypothetical protein TRIUR3_26652 [Triticum urartu]
MDAEGETGRSKRRVIGSIVFCHMEGNVVQPNRRKRKRAAQRISRSSGGGDEVDEAEAEGGD